MTARDILRFHKRTGGPRVTVSTATFQGQLRVTDPDAVRNALLTGISPAKGYGQGLLTLAPSRRRPRGAEAWWMAVTTTKSSPRPRG
ncbi:MULTISPECIES: type I-E CRISPR-associated protein Cas6/Cse3/CasE [Streptomyces]|uniref:type I-E CRISPR-associated protein Cas6/Cse3/CasE n=1 Tax=Streptomyces TaxID=1883 RepID=UPI0029ABBF01|nr:type I-E CRISPR-associated protein Cas6/Cse3/CasE [Streptomyces sp. AK02-04a]MDX3762971.1 type I-E CRISPR-associated protein Cas6/Cse3/CasE [Streptomyces sp. AK02-04a]